MNETVASTGPRSSRAARWRPRGLAFLTGVAAALAHPPFGVLPALLAYGLLMRLFDRAADQPRPLRTAFAAGWIAGLGYFLVGVWWVVEAFMVDAASQAWLAPFALAALASYLALWWGLAGVAYRLTAPGGPSRVLVFAGMMTMAEWLRGHVLTGFPWNLPGESWAAGSAVSQAAAVVGVYGLTFLTLLIAACLCVVLEGRPGRNLARAALLGLAGLWIGGLVRLAAPAPAPPGTVVRLVQPDVAQEVKYTEAAFADIVSRYQRLTARPRAGGGAPPEVVIWPEGAIPASINEYIAPGTWTRDVIEGALEPGQVLFVGAYRIEPSEAGVPLYYNSLIPLRRDAHFGFVIDGLYDKHRLVPGGEFLPFDQVWASLGVKKLVNVGDGFTPGPAPRPLTVEGLPPFQPLICYESLFPGFTRSGSGPGLADRPSWIVNISNDAWFGATSGPWQHLNLAAYWAIEEGLPMVRATPTGVSAMIDARGRITASLPLGAQGVIDAALPGAEPPTPFARYGDWALGLLLIAAAAATQPARRWTALVKRRKS